ncbi:MAG: hypothetical protein IJ438_12605 [Clostridia bacterium]|nr:hypothetical protein [Clostridia bacterium]
MIEEHFDEQVLIDRHCLRNCCVDPANSWAVWFHRVIIPQQLVQQVHAANRLKQNLTFSVGGNMRELLYDA